MWQTLISGRNPKIINRGNNMFIQVIVLAIIIGFIFKGNFKNLSSIKIEALYLILASFLMEAVVIMSIRKGFIHIGYVTYFIDAFMYALIFVFVYKNRKSPFILIMGFGFLLNAVAIFSNGGTMPVGVSALHAAGINQSVGSQGLYVLIGNNTMFWFLGDIFPYTFLNKNIVSLGDLVAALGMLLLIVKGMRQSEIR